MSDIYRHGLLCPCLDCVVDREHDATVRRTRADHQKRMQALREAGLDETHTRAYQEQLRDSGHWSDR